MQKPAKTLADYVVVAISPILIIILVGSLTFFLVQVFYRGEMVQGIRWVVFWFVMAIVLVSRVSIEQGKGHGRVYGAALAIVTWIYLAHTHGTPMIGALLLAVTWWCAHRLTVDCTLINEDEDASGEGVLQGLWRRLEKSLVPPAPEPELPPLSPLEMLAAADLAKRRRQTRSRPPGRSVVYFSLAALPLFGVGQLFLPADDLHARRIGFGFLVLYLAAALSLLITTSFLGLRRYLRQRLVEMPTSITFGWLKFGALLAGCVLLLALILPRPGARSTWKELTYRIAHKEHKASDYALPLNPPGEGEGTPTEQPVDRTRPGADSRRTSIGTGTPNTRTDSQVQSNPRDPRDPPAQSDRGSGGSAGTDGKSGNSDERSAPSRQQLQVRDVTPSAGDDQSSRKDQPAASGASDGSIRDGAGGRLANADPSRERDETANQPQRKQVAEQKTAASRETPNQPEQEQSENSGRSQRQPSDLLYKLLRALFILVLAALCVWLLVRHRKVIAEMIRAFSAAVRDFFRKLFSFRRRKAAPEVEDIPPPATPLQAFAAYENPFITGKDKTWSPERLVLYTYEAVQAWAKERGIEVKHQQTPREFCFELIERFPDFGPELQQFSSYYGHAAYARRLPDDFETESIRGLWQGLGDSIMAVASR